MVYILLNIEGDLLMQFEKTLNLCRDLLMQFEKNPNLCPTNTQRHCCPRETMSDFFYNMRAEVGSRTPDQRLPMTG